MCGIRWEILQTRSLCAAGICRRFPGIVVEDKSVFGSSFNPSPHGEQVSLALWNTEVMKQRKKTQRSTTLRTRNPSSSSQNSSKVSIDMQTAGRECTLDMLSRWISLRRSAAQVAEVLELSCTCSADVIASEIHQIGAVASEPEQYRNRTPGELLVIACTAILIDVQGQGAKLDIKPHHLARRKEWPHKSAQVLPHGPADTAWIYGLAGDR
jgi:hypothetical protein